MYNSSATGSLLSTPSSSYKHLAPKISDFNEEKLFTEGLMLARGARDNGNNDDEEVEEAVNYFASSQFIGHLAARSTTGSIDESSNDMERDYSNAKSRNRLLLIFFLCLMFFVYKKKNQ